MQFRYTILYVEDVRESLAFFEKAFGFTPLFVHPEGDYGELDTGATKLAFSSHKLMRQLGKNPAAARADAPCFELAFETEDVAAAYARAVEAGAEPQQEPAEMPWGQTVSYVTKYGFLIEVCSPVSVANTEAE